MLVEALFEIFGMTLLLIAAGLIALFLGGEALVRGASGVARALGVSPLLIGLVVVGFGTSAPELTTSISAALQGSPAVAAGNVVGSNIANILLILGVSALIGPIAVNRAAFTRDGTVLITATLIIAALLAFTGIGRLTGAALVAGLIAYVVFSYVADRRGRSAAADLHAAEADLIEPANKPLVAAAMLAAGLIGVVGGAALLVRGAVSLAEAAGLSEAVIGLTIVAVGTSLPELAASISAARRGQSDIALGNIVGSNIFNALGILGATALVEPFTAGAGLALLDLAVMIAAALVLIGFAMTGWKIDRREGAILLIAYSAYIAWLAFGGP
jgi:cation:H+ antiporter